LRGSILDEMRLKPRLDSKNLDIAIARPIAVMNTAAALRPLRQFKLAIRAA